jgi:hypothetical protein
MVARMRGIAKILFTLMHTLVPLLTLRTPCVNAAAKNRTDYAHRKCRVMQHVVARLCSVSAPCLQIRVGRFDSGPRLQSMRIIDDSMVRFFSSAHSAHSLHTFNAVKHLPQAVQKTCVLQNRVRRVVL